MHRTSKSAFTLIEILVTLGIVAVLSTVVVVTLNPAELIKQARDSTRISDLNTVNTALGTYAADATSAFVGTSSIVYVSIPDSSPTCANLSLPALSGGWTYSCATQDNYKKTDGTGWIPANLSRISFGSPLEKLPIDPKNSTSTGLYYTFVTTGSWWELTAILESDKYGPRMVIDGGASPNAFEQGTDLTLTPVEALDRGFVPTVFAPVISSISPTSTTAGDPGFTLTVNGANFTSSSVVKWGASTSTTTFVSDTQLTASISSGDVAATGTIAVTVSDPIGGGSIATNFAISERTQFIAGAWTTDSSGGIAQSYGASIVEVGSNIYVVPGGGTSFQRYNPTTKVWESLAAIPGAADMGSAIAKYDNDTIYLLQGNSATGFYKYVISTNTWTTKATVPGNVYWGGALTYPGSGDYIYAFQGNNSTAFWRYSVSNNSWGESGVAQNTGSSIIEVNGKIYITAGNNSTTFQKYDPSTRSWTTLAVVPGAVDIGAAILKYDNDTIYLLRGNSTTGFYKYVISTNTWTTKAVTPANVWWGGALAYPGSGDYIYAFMGNDNRAFWRYSVSNDSWGESGVAQYSGSSIVEVSGKIYMVPGNNTNTFKKYDPSTRSWTTLAVVPGLVDIGAAIVKYDNDTIYLLRGNSTTGFYKYVISTNTWTTKAVAPGNVWWGGALAYPGSGNYIYAFQGNSNAFWRYSITGNSWSAFATAPTSMLYGSALAATDSDTLYAFAGGDATTFYQYKIASSTWTAKASAPDTVMGGGSLSSDGTNIYATRGRATASLWKYSPGTNSWTVLSAAPGNIGHAGGYTMGGATYSSSLNKVYAISGVSDGVSGSIFEYDISSNAWPATYTPEGVSYGAAMVGFDSDSLYTLRGNDTTTFWQYTISSGLWTVKAVAPATVMGGSSLSSDGTNIYATRGRATASFWKYSPGTNSWTTLSSAPANIGNSGGYTMGGATYSSSLNKVYAISGISSGASGSIFEYDISLNAWPSAYTPLGVEYGGALAALDSDTLYAFKGSDTTTFWEYKISTGIWTTKKVTPATVMGGGSLVSDGTNVFATRGRATKSFWKYSPSTNLWSTLSNTPANIGNAGGYTMGGLIYSSSQNAVYAISGNSGSIYKNSP